MNNRPIFHEGELDAQRRAGEDDIAAHVSRVIQPFIVAGALPFLRQQPLLFLASEDPAHNLWASVLFGSPGFVDPAGDGKSLRIHLDRTIPQPHDPLLTNLLSRPQVGLVLIEFSTRRRIKINGTVQQSGDTLLVQVTESYAICPKYIQKRDIQLLTTPSQSTAGAQSGTALQPHQLAQISRADTFFVASSHATYGPDISHRGGKPGFVQVLPNGALRIPDYRGNSLLSSFGNFTVNPHAGLLFLDYTTRRLLQLSGRASLEWDQPDPANETGGTHRFWQFHTKLWRESPLPTSVHERFLEPSPFNP